MVKELKMTMLKERFAEYDGKSLIINDQEQPYKMANSFGTALPLFSHNGFGADIIRFSAGEGVQNHVHPGDHILFTLSGNGYVIYEGVPHELSPGICYFVNGSAAHAIKAVSSLVLIAVGNKHYPATSVERMTPIPYDKETSLEFRV